MKWALKCLGVLTRVDFHSLYAECRSVVGAGSSDDVKFLVPFLLSTLHHGSVIVKACESAAQTAATYLSQILARQFFVPMCTILIACLSRLYSLCQSLLHFLNDACRSAKALLPDEGAISLRLNAQSTNNEIPESRKRQVIDIEDLGEAMDSSPEFDEPIMMTKRPISTTGRHIKRRREQATVSNDREHGDGRLVRIEPDESKNDEMREEVSEEMTSEMSRKWMKYVHGSSNRRSKLHNLGRLLKQKRNRHS